MEFDPGFNIQVKYSPLGFVYGEGVFGPVVEKRKLEDIRPSLLDPGCNGPEVVYAIAMDVGKESDREMIFSRNLLYGAVTYASGRLGKEPVRSQGHVHAVSPSCNSSTPEIYEIWAGEAIIYMQEHVTDDPGRCFAVYAKPGDVVIVPPGWAHATISANPHKPLTFGAWCVRDYAFDYTGVRRHHGLAWFPLLTEEGEINWIKNDRYVDRKLVEKEPRHYEEFSLEKGVPIYKQFEQQPDRFLFVSHPQTVQEKWNHFIP